MNEENNVLVCHACNVMLPAADLGDAGCPECGRAMEPTTWIHWASLFEEEGQCEFGIGPIRAILVRSFHSNEVHLLLEKDPSPASNP